MNVSACWITIEIRGLNVSKDAAIEICERVREDLRGEELSAIATIRSTDGLDIRYPIAPEAQSEEQMLDWLRARRS